MLVALGVSFATWDSSAVKAANADLSSYANAKVGDIIKFGRYYQTLEQDEKGEYIKTPIEWIIVDKDERTGQLTLMSKYILAAGSYFGNWYVNSLNDNGHYYYNKSASEISDNTFNQAYVDSTARAFLNNLERMDLGGDIFDAVNGYVPSGKNSTKDTYDATNNGHFKKGTGLLSSVGFSNQRYWTGLNTDNAPLLENMSGLHKRLDPTSSGYSEYYYQRPVNNPEYVARPATKGFFDEAFDETEKAKIIPKTIAGYTGNRWPDNAYNTDNKTYIEGVVDKVWLPSATELNVAQGKDWNSEENSSWTNPSDEAGSTVFEYFKNYQNYTNPISNDQTKMNASVTQSLKTVRTEFAKNAYIGNYSIPVYMYRDSTQINTDISDSINSSDNYWTRSPSAYQYTVVQVIYSTGQFYSGRTHLSHIGVRPCVILGY